MYSSHHPPSDSAFLLSSNLQNGQIPNLVEVANFLERIMGAPPMFACQGHKVKGKRPSQALLL